MPNLNTRAASPAQPRKKSQLPKTAKTFVLDTNVLIHDPGAIFHFEHSRIVIPLSVIEELDNFKRLNDERGYSVRQVMRWLNRLRERGKLSGGIPLESGAELAIEYHKGKTLPVQLNGHGGKDNDILATALYLHEQGERVVLISKDLNLRIKAEVLGLEAEDYEKEKAPIADLYRGFREVSADQELIDRFFKEHRLEGLKVGDPFLPNEFVVLKSADAKSQSALARYKPSSGLTPLAASQRRPWGVKPMNTQQRFALELLLDPEVGLVCLIGVPGSGKTMLALAAGLEQVFETGQYRRLLISRPVVPVGRDIGYLPGSKEEKLSSWIGAIRDNIEFLSDSPGQGEAEDAVAKANEILESDKIEIEAVSFLRGRSLPRTFFIIDDAQNLSPHEVKTIISRAGEGTKIVLTGDPYQIDDPYLDAASNGLSNLVDRFKGQGLFGVVRFDKTVRSNLAGLANDLL